MHRNARPACDSPFPVRTVSSVHHGDHFEPDLGAGQRRLYPSPNAGRDLRNLPFRRGQERFALEPVPLSVKKVHMIRNLSVYWSITFPILERDGLSAPAIFGYNSPDASDLLLPCVT